MVPVSDRNRFELWVERYGPELLHYCRRFANGCPERAQDLLQETFAAAWKDRARVQDDAPRAWLFEIARRRCLYEIRKQKRLEPLDEKKLSALCEDTDACALEDPLARQRLEKALSGLGPVDELIIRARFGLRPLKDSSGRKLEPTDHEIAGLVKLELDQTISIEAVRKLGPAAMGFSARVRSTGRRACGRSKPG